MPRVAIYCRLSIEDKNKCKSDDSQSIQNQKLMLKEYCRERDWEIYDIYCDDGYSGIDRNRPAFLRMLQDCEQGRIDIVLCKDQSRFSRDTIVIEQFINDKFLEWNVRFIGVVDNADSDSESYSTMRLFTSAYNEMYVKDISGKIRKTLHYKREQGQFVGSFAPFGYAIDAQDKHHLVVDAEAAPVVQQIFDLFVQGWGYRRIVQHLNEEGIPSPAKYKAESGSHFVSVNEQNSSARGLWTHSTIYNILRNEMYTGTLVQGKSHNVSYKNKKKKKVPPAQWVRVPNAHEAIIDMQTWEKVQSRLQSRTRASSVDQTLSPLSGKVKCAVCGKPMKRGVYYNKSRTIQYYNLTCASYKTGAMNCPNVKSISGLKLEATILDALNALVAQYCCTEDIRLTDTYQEQLTALQKQKANLQRLVETAESRLTALYKDKLDGTITAQEYGIFSEQFRTELQDLHTRSQETEAQLERCQSLQTSEEERKALIQKYSHFTKLTRTIAEEFIDTVSIGEFDEEGNRIIQVSWNI